MARLLAIVFALAVTITCQSASVTCAIIRAQNGQVVIGRRTGGSFGPGSFTVGEPGRSGPGGVGGQGGNINNVPPRGWALDSSDEDDSSNHQGSSNVAQNGFNRQKDYQNPHITGFSRGDDGASIVIDEITGGSYPDGSFSLGRRDSNGKSKQSSHNGGDRYPGQNAGQQPQEENFDEPSVYEAGSFSIGHGKNTVYGNGGRGADVTGGTVSYPREAVSEPRPHGRQSQNEGASYSIGHGKNSVNGHGAQSADVIGEQIFFPDQIEQWSSDSQDQQDSYNVPKKNYFKRFSSWLGSYSPF